METGKFLVDRSIFNYASLMEEKHKFSKLEALLYIIANTVEDKKEVEIEEDIVIALQRGEFYKTYEELKNDWCWNENEIASFFVELKNNGFCSEIVTDGQFEFEFLEICNYKKHQSKFYGCKEPIIVRNFMGNLQC